MLIGSFDHALDAKGRVFIPSKWRDCLGDTIVVTVGLLQTQKTNCLYGMSVSEWDTFSEKLASLPITDVEGQAVRRKLYAMAAACETDKQGRILIPTQLRDVAGLDKDATLIGIGNRIEIWNPATLEQETSCTDEAYETALKHLAELGI